MSLSPFDSFQSRFVTYLLNCPRTNDLVVPDVQHNEQGSFVFSNGLYLTCIGGGGCSELLRHWQRLRAPPLSTFEGSVPLL
jgi:hypothetical protein